MAGSSNEGSNKGSTGGKPILLICLAREGKCEYCDNYRKNLEKLFQKAVLEDGRMDLVEAIIEVIPVKNSSQTIRLTGISSPEGRQSNSSIKDSPVIKIPVHLTKYVEWWPFFVLLTRSAWLPETARKRDLSSRELGIAIFGGAINAQGEVISIPGDHTLNLQNLMKWINGTLVTEPFKPQIRSIRRFLPTLRSPDPYQLYPSEPYLLINQEQD